MDIHDLDDLRYPYDLGNHHMCHGQKRDCQKQFKGSLVFFTDDYKPKNHVLGWSPARWMGGKGPSLCLYGL